ncbi:hypothetical protein ANTPLA_LOCUS1899 [Anthophora plagiata]
MRTFVVSLLIVSVIAAEASASVKRLEKRGVIGGHGYSSGLEVSGDSGLSFGTHGVQADVNYLPPASSLSVVKKHYSVPSGPAPVYSVPALGPAPVPAPVYGAPISAPVSTYGVPNHSPVPVFKDPVPAPAYSSFPAPISSISSVNSGLNLGYAGLPSTSYGVPSTVVGSVPHAQISFGSAGLPSTTYGVPSSYASGSGISSGLSLSHLKSASLPSSLYGGPSSSVHGGLNDGYAYPVPSKKLLI